MPAQLVQVRNVTDRSTGRGQALVIWGRHDPYLPPALAGRRREAFPDAEVQILEESGHWPFIDQPDRVERLCVGFLERTLAAGRESELQTA